MSNEVPETFSMPLAGRDIEFRKPLLGQILVLNRLAQRGIKAAREGDDEERGRAMTASVARTLDFIETLIVHDEDKIFVEDAMLAGTIDWADVMKVLAGGRESDDTPDDEAPRPIARAPKKKAETADAAVTKMAAARPAAKTVASRGRTER